MDFSSNRHVMISKNFFNKQHFMYLVAWNQKKDQIGFKLIKQSLFSMWLLSTNNLPRQKLNWNSSLLLCTKHAQEMFWFWKNTGSDIILLKFQWSPQNAMHLHFFKFHFLECLVYDMKLYILTKVSPLLQIVV